jgi:hypothetical protein
MEKKLLSLIVQIKKNATELSILNDGIRNPLTIISSLIEIDEREGDEKILDEVRKIDQIVRQPDIRWIQSEKIFSCLTRHYGISTRSTQKPDSIGKRKKLNMGIRGGKEVLIPGVLITDSTAGILRVER